MNGLKLKSESECKYDILSLGEIMLRLDPGQERIHTTRQFKASEGGGEYNVARGLKRCFGKRAAVVTAIVDNPVGRLLEDLLYQGGVSLEYVKWVPFDGIGRKTAYLRSYFQDVQYTPPQPTKQPRVSQNKSTHKPHRPVINNNYPQYL